MKLKHRNPNDKFNPISDIDFNKEWNPRDWQGRSKKSVENNYKIMDMTFKVIAVSFILWSIYQVTINII